MLKKILLGLLLLPLTAQAAHITDRLLAGMYSSPKVSNEPIKLLPSGTPLEILTEKSGFVKIELVDGERGWVEKRFLSGDKPAKVRLLVLQAKHKQTQNEFDTVKKELIQLKAKQAGVAVKNSGSVNKELVELKKAHQILKDKLQSSVLIGQQPSSVEPPAKSAGEAAGLSWAWLLLSALIFIPCALLAGVFWQDKRQRARHGGFRI